ncbi:MAG: hypothetical protein QOJ91_1352 [Sphingomonadales bacterium]|nr:hypothetical protein [Sphingomonadales bacterium]
MGVYLVTWKLSAQLEREEGAIEALEAALTARLEAYDFLHHEDFERVYFVATPLSAGQLNGDLHAGLEPDDMVIIARLTAHAYCGWLPQVMWDWIEERLDPPPGVAAEGAPDPSAD